MKQLLIATIAYNKFNIIEKSLRNFYQKLEGQHRHVLIDNLYPYGDSKKLKTLCEELKIEYLNYGENIGLFNSIYKIQEMCEEEYIMLHEGNNIVLDANFDTAMLNAFEKLKSNEKETLLSLSNEFSKELKIFEKDDIKYSIENNGNTERTTRPIGFPYGGINLSTKGFLNKVSSYYRDIYFNDPYVNFSRENRVIYILRTHREISHAYYQEENIEYKLYKMITAFIGYKRSFEDFLKLCDENIEYIYIMANRIDRRVLSYIGYSPEKPITRSKKDA